MVARVAPARRKIKRKRILYLEKLVGETARLSRRLISERDAAAGQRHQSRLDQPGSGK